MKTKISVPEGVPFIDIEREFDAPADLVHRAFLEPDLIVQWLGPRKYKMTLDKWDARPGGAYRYVHGNEEGQYAFHGVFHSTDIDNLVQTFEFEGWPGRVALDQIVIEDLGNGRSRVRGHSVYQAVADRDAMAESGMAEGVDDGYNRLDELLARIGQPVVASR
jgi:uncharacterized protein YndB with AHSA1/START domain